MNVELEKDFRLLPSMDSILGTFDMLLSCDPFLERKLFFSSDDLLNILGNISSLLKPGAFWTGICFDSSEIWLRIVKNPLKPSFSTQNGLIKVELKNISKLFPQDPLIYYPESSLGTEWLSSSQTFGIDIIVSMENKLDHLFLIHFPTLIGALKKVGMKCLSIRNLNEFYDIFKTREEDQLKKMGILSSKIPHLLPEQKDAMSLFCVYVFQKENIVSS